MKETIIPGFAKTYERLKTVCPDIEPFDASAIYKNPDGGWQMTFIGQAAITLSPQQIEQHTFIPFFSHGSIFRRWVAEGGAWDENCIKGRFGYPIGDEEASHDNDGECARQYFERAAIRSFDSGETEVDPVVDLSESPSLFERVLRHLPLFSLFYALQRAEEPWRGSLRYLEDWGERKKV